jgi:hypothetical protein
MHTDRLMALIQMYQGTPVDRDGVYGAQCMDWVNLYVVDRGHAPLSGNAVDVPRQHVAGATWIPNGPVNFPVAGDIVCFAANVPTIGTGPYGHVAVAVVGNPHSLISSDQNWNGAHAVQIWSHSYAGVLGWWRLH